jgi:outer membrane lipase/esterase
MPPPRYILVFNLPDVGNTPFGRGSGQGASITALSSFFNSTLSTGLDALHVDVIRLNVFSLLNEVVADPAKYGFTNASSPACTVTSLLCTSSTLVAPNAAQTYVFADSVHPTTATHQVIADYAASVLEAPQKIGLLAEAPLQVEQANFRAIDDRMWSSLNAPRAQNKFDAYAVYDYGNYDHSGDFGGGSDHLNTVTLGGDMKLSEHLLVGLAFGYSEDKASFGDNGGGFKLNEASLTAYVGYGQGPWYVGATLGAGDLDFRNIHRTFALGGGSRTETGDTNGTNVTARVLGGYWFNTTANWLHGPFARLTYQQNKVYAWSEEGTSSTAMSFGHQRASRWSLAWLAGERHLRIAADVRASDMGKGIRQRRAHSARRSRIDWRHRLRPAGASSRRQLRAVRDRRQRRSWQQAHRLRQRRCDGLQGRRQLPGGDAGCSPASLSIARARKRPRHAASQLSARSPRICAR